MRPVTIGSASNVPTREPESTTAVAKARSLFGNHLDAAFVELGYAGDSPAPRANRTAKKPQKLVASGVRTVKTDHQIAANENARREPALSVNQPASSIIP